ncbi:MAG: nucleotidyltransferase family protein [Xanthomonadales bacterium]|nr:nucleotidyltransferase family protein [Xanthomonadales bacterium]
MILAAGRGERLRPLTDETPKPLIEVGGKPLIEHHVEALANAGFRELVVNLAHLGDQIEAALGDGSRFGVNIAYSRDPEGALETGGGIVQALDLLGQGAFAVVNGDIFTDFPFSRLRSVKCDLAHLVLVPNPDHNPDGDFALDGARIRNQGARMGTFSGIAVYHPRFFADCSPGRFSVVPLLRKAIETHLVSGAWHRGLWNDIGTIGRLEKMRAMVR